MIVKVCWMDEGECVEIDPVEVPDPVADQLLERGLVYDPFDGDSFPGPDDVGTYWTYIGKEQLAWDALVELGIIKEKA